MIYRFCDCAKRDYTMRGHKPVMSGTYFYVSSAMPLKRRRSAKRSASNKRFRRFRRTRTRGRVGGSTSTHAYRQKLPATGVAATGSNVYGVLGVSASAIPQISTLTALYDQYKIDKVVWKWFPQFTESTWPNSGSSTQFVPRIYIARDYDDYTTPTTLQQVQEYGNCKTFSLLKPFRLVQKRIYTSSNQNLSGVPANQTIKFPWADCTYDAILTDVWKYAITATASVSALGWWDCTVYIRFRNVR